MTGPIKPPAPPSGAPPVCTVDATTASSGADFRTDALTVPDTPRSREAAPLAGLDGVLGSIADELRSGKLTPEQAVEQLVGKMLASPMAGLLAPEARARLESVVRAQLADDPTLAALVADLGRARTGNR